MFPNDRRAFKGPNLQQRFKALHLGKVAYHLYYQPKGRLNKTLDRGFLNSFIDARARKAMENTAYKLPKFETSPPFFDIHFLTGDRFWYQTLFCAYSMAQQSNLSLRPIIYDDGSLSEKYQSEIRRVFPEAHIYQKAELDERIESHLPQHRFPYLRERRENYPNIRKLIDVHVGSSGWKLVLDSDMLFFRSPDALLDWLKDPQQPCHMVDIETSYGYSLPFMASLVDASISERVNVGICGLNSSHIDWEELEYWCRTLIEKSGTSYYQEQALVAMLVADKACQIVNQADYLVMPTESEVISPKAILHHYVADSKPWYFRYAWEHIEKIKQFNNLDRYD